MPIKNNKLSEQLMTFTYKNIVKNGNFINTADWTARNCTTSALNNTLFVTGDGTLTTPLVAQTIVPVIAANKKYYIECIAKVTNSVSTAIRIRCTATAGTSISVSTVAAPMQDVEYKLSGIMTITNQTGALEMQVVHYYATSDAANNKVLEIKRIFSIDLTDLYGSGNEPSATDCANIFKFVDGNTQPNFSKQIAT